MTNSVTYQVNLKVVGDNVIGQVTAEIDKMNRSTQKATKTFGDCFKSLLSFSLAADGLRTLEQGFNDLIQPGVTLNSQMAELSAITGVTGKGLKEIEQAARVTSKTFGTDASANVESYKLILSQLDPEIAKNAEAMKMMGENVNILSKQMGGDTVTATNVLTTSMNQFGVSTENPIAAAKIMADMMNVMSASAQAGSAELPQIQSALEQVGMVAKTTGLSFAETNAQIQVLDKAGKKGSEGGIALRNVLTTLSEGRFTSKLAAQGLAQAGISVGYLADQSIPLTDRLRTLRKIQGDTALMTKVFGKENMAAAIAVIDGADKADELTKQITGTNSAMEEADIIMGSYTEKMTRYKAWVDNLKIGFFNLIEPIAPFTQKLFSAFNAMGQMAVSGNALVTIYDAMKVHLWKNTLRLWKNTIATKANTIAKWIATKATNIWKRSLMGINKQMTIGTVVSLTYSRAVKTIRGAMIGATAGTRAFSVAIMNIPVIGWIIAGITAIIAGLVLLWNHSKRFREILFGIGYAGKAVFHNIGVVIGRVWNLIIKPILSFWWNTHKQLFSNIWAITKKVVTAIGKFFMWLWSDIIKPVGVWIWESLTAIFMGIWETVVNVFTAIGEFGSAVWNWLVKLLGGFGAWINEVLVQPVKNMFTTVWDWIMGLVDNVMGKLKAVFGWVADIWNAIFSDEGMINVNTAYHEGEKAGTESFERSKKEKDKPQEVTLVEDDHKSIFDVSKGSGVKTPTIGGVAVDSINKKGVGGSKSDSGNKVRNLTVGKFMDNFNVYMNASNGIDKNQLLQAIREVLLTASADFAMAE